MTFYSRFDSLFDVLKKTVRKVSELYLKHFHLHKVIDVLYQTVNSDGLLTSITLKGNFGRIELIFSYLSDDSPFSDLYEVCQQYAIDEDVEEMTIFFKDFVLPLAIPVQEMCESKVAPIDEPIKEIDGLILVSRAPVPVSNQSQAIADNLRPMTILLSLVDWCLYHGTFGENTIRVMTKEMADRAENMSGTAAEVMIKHRFITPENAPAEFLFAKFLKLYFKEKTFLPMDKETIEEIRKFMTFEVEWLSKHKAKVGSCDYIDGIIDCDFTKTGDFPSHTLPAMFGVRSITRSMKQYEYAVSRFKSRKYLASWESFTDLSHATCAADMEGFTTFVYRLPTGGIIYGFRVENSGSASRLECAVQYIKKMGFKGDPPMINGFSVFKSTQFNTNTMAIYTTSGCETQGTLYRLEVYVS